MAKLIKFRLAPHKMVLAKSLSILKCNRVISLNAVSAMQAKRATVLEQMATAKATIKKFYDEQAVLAERSERRGNERFKGKLIRELVKLLLQFKENQRHESVAMDNLARTIAANITNSSKVFDKMHDKPEATAPLMMNEMCLTVSLPKEVMEKNAALLQTFQQNLGPLANLQASEDNEKSSLKLCLLDISVSLDFESRTFLRSVSSAK